MGRVGGNSLTLVSIRNATRNRPGIDAATVSDCATKTNLALEWLTRIYWVPTMCQALFWAQQVEQGTKQTSAFVPRIPNIISLEIILK